MAKIRKFYRKKKNSNFALSSPRSYNFSFPLFLHSMLPLRFKFLKEEFTALSNKRVVGSLSANPTKGIPARIKISEILFIEGCYDVAKQLLEFVISHYGAKGATSFWVKVSSSYPELLNLLVSQYNFRQCSYEKLWKVSRRKYEEFTYSLNVRPFKNSDAASVSVMHNESLVAHFRPSLSLTAQTFTETLFKGLQEGCEYKYIVEDRKSANPVAYFSISTKDNENYVLDIIQTSWYQTAFDDIIAFACAEVKKRTLNFNLYVKSKKYTAYGMSYEDFLARNSFLVSQTNAVLVKDYYSPVNIKDESSNVVMLGLPSY